jgi:hypothetical protein
LRVTTPTSAVIDHATTLAISTETDRRLSDQQLRELLVLLDDADSIELKVTVPESTQRSAVSSLGMDPLNAQIRQVFFFDTPDLDLYRSGLVVRARRSQGKRDDTVVKLRPVVPGALPQDVRRSPNVGVEVDAMPGGYVCSASMKGAPSVDVRGITSSQGPIGKLFSKEQRAFFTTYAPDGISLDDLTVLGPINVFKLKFKPRGYAGRLVAELWLYPDTSRILELSTKCQPEEALSVAVKTRLFLSEAGVDLSSEQQTKTKTALEYFAKGVAG